MANRYWVGGGSSTNWNATGNTNWASTSGGANNASVPTSTDDVFFDANSGSGTANISASITVKSINCTGFTGTWTQASSTTLTVAGSLLLVSGMTYAPSADTQAISISATGTVTTAGKSLGNFSVSGSGITVTLADNMTLRASSTTFTLTQGTCKFDGASDNSGLTHNFGIFNSNNSNTRTATMGTATVIMSNTGNSFDFRTSTNCTFQCGTSLIQVVNGAGFLYGSNAGGGTTFYSIKSTGGSFNFNGTNKWNTQNSACTNFTIEGSASKTVTVTWDTAQNPLGSISGTLTLTGNSSVNRLFIVSATFGTLKTISIGGSCTVTPSNCDFRDIAFSTSQDFSSATGGSGNCLGNSGITFTSAQTNYWVGNGGSWSDVNKWANSSGGAGASGRVPLPQDDVVFDASSFNAGSQTITMDMPRLGNDVTMTNIDSSPTLSKSITVTQYGSLAFGSGLGSTAFSAGWTFHGRSKSCTLDLAGKTVNGGGSGTWTIQMPSGTMTLTSSFQMSAFIDRVLDVISGTFDSAGFSVNIGAFVSSGSSTRTVTMGSSIWILTGSGTVWNVASSLTLNSNTSTISITDTGSGSKTFTGGGKTYNNLSITVGGTGAIIIQNNNTWTRMLKSGTGTKTIQFTAGSIQTFTGGTNCFFSGTSGNLITCQSTSNGSAWTVTKTSDYVSSDFISLRDSTATGGASWFAGANSTNVSGNTGWIFTAPVFTETLSMTIVSDTSLTDLQNYVENLSFTIISDTSLNDLQNYVENLNFTIVSDISVSDFQTYIENLNFTIIGIVEIEENLVFPKDTFKPIFLKRKQVIAIDLTRKLIIPLDIPVNKITDLNIKRMRTINVKVKDNEPIKISLRRKIR